MIHDESLYSFIYRSQRLRGFMQTQNVITPSGNWRSYPKVLPELINYYKGYNEKELITILNESGLISRERYWLNSPFYFQETLKNTFFSIENTAKSIRSIPILFCPECVKESINNKGFGYFKTDWVFNDYCKVHRERLFRITAKTNNESNEGVRHALSGIVSSSHATQNYKVRFRKKRQSRVAPYTLSACFFVTFERWLAHNRLYLPISFYMMMAEKCHIYLFDILYTKLGTYRYISDENINNILEILYIIKPKIFRNDFIKKLCKITNQKAGVNKTNDVIFQTLKIKSHNCDKCPHRKSDISCYISKSIVRTFVYPGIGNYNFNYCDNLLENKKSIKMSKSSKYSTSANLPSEISFHDFLFELAQSPHLDYN